MPFGVSWMRYISLITIGMGSMLAGSQVVHNMYRPLDDLMNLVDKELQELNRKQVEESMRGPLWDVEKVVDRYENMRREFEEYEKKKKPT